MSNFGILKLYSTFKFGKHEGKMVREVDKGYIEYLIKNTSAKFSDEVYEFFNIEEEKY